MALGIAGDPRRRLFRLRNLGYGARHSALRPAPDNAAVSC
jgi:hypothetical protein